jgi:hypothetical protein
VSLVKDESPFARDMHCDGALGRFQVRMDEQIGSQQQLRLEKKITSIAGVAWVATSGGGREWALVET